MLPVLGIGWPGIAHAAWNPPQTLALALTTAGERAAHMPLLRAQDLRSGWRGGEDYPSLGIPACQAFRIELGGLVVVGNAYSVFDSISGRYTSQVLVYRDAAMLERDVERNFAVGYGACIREQTGREGGSVRELSIPRIAAHVRAYRSRFTTTVRGRDVRLVTDRIVIGEGRTKLVLTRSFHAGEDATGDELRIARALVARIATKGRTPAR